MFVAEFLLCLQNTRQWCHLGPWRKLLFDLPGVGQVNWVHMDGPTVTRQVSCTLTTVKELARLDEVRARQRLLASYPRVGFQINPVSPVNVRGTAG